jgi:succinoglycan biosynthesis transport protein ExoP
MSPIQNQVTITRRPPDIEDYIDMVRRYRSWIIGPMFAGLVVATVIAFLWPDTYVSSAVMRITPQQVPEKLLPSMMTNQMTERLAQMQTEILSRNSLAEIIQKPALDLYKKERLKVPIEDVVQEMKNKHIRITPIADGGRRGSSSFQISYSYTDRYKALAVVRELVSKFTESNVTVQKNAAAATTTLLDDTKKRAKEKMDALEGQLVKFKAQNQGRLPDQAAANVQQMSTINLQIMNLSSQVNTVASDKMMLENTLKLQKGREKLEQSRLEQTVVVPGGSNTEVRNEYLMGLDRQISIARSNLAAQKQLFGKNHPDVLNAEAILNSFEEQKLKALANVEAPVVTPSTTRTVVNLDAQRALEELKNDVSITEAQIAVKQSKMDEIGRSIEQLNRQLSTYQKRLEEAPQSEQQYYALVRELDLAKNEYTEMSKRRETAETQVSIEEHKAGEQLEMLDPPFLPDRAAEPNRPVWAAAGVFGGLVVGLMLAAAKEVKDASLKNLKDVRAYTNLPVLSSIPLLENALLVRRKRRLVWLAWTSAVVIGTVVMGATVYYHMTI